MAYVNGSAARDRRRSATTPYPANGLVPGGIVRRTVIRVRNTVAIAIALVPAPALQLPPVVMLRPRWLRVIVSGALPLPVTGLPDVLLAPGIPVARRPHITAAWRGDRFISNLRRRSVEINADIGTCHRRDHNGPKSSRAQHGDQRSTESHAIFLCSEPVSTAPCNPYVEFVLASDAQSSLSDRGSLFATPQKGLA